MYTEASDLFLGDIARLRSPVETLNEPHCLQFWYMLYGRDLRYIRAYLYKPGTGIQVKHTNVYGIRIYVKQMVSLHDTGM